MSPRGYHLHFYYYHVDDTSVGGLWVLEGIIYTFITITWTIPLLVDYESSRVSSTLLLLSRGRYLCWWTMSPRGYHLHFYYYHVDDTSVGGLWVLEGIIYTFITITWTIPLLVDYESSRVSSTLLLLSRGRYLWWWTMSPRGYHLHFYYYHWDDTSVGGLLVLEGIIYTFITITWTIPLLVDYESSRVSSTLLLLSLGRYLWWWTMSPRGYHLHFYYYHWDDTSVGGLLVLEGIIYTFITITWTIPLLVDYESSRVSSTLLLLSLGRYLCWWTMSPRGYHLHFYYYHWDDTSVGGLLVLEGIIYTFITITGTIPLLVDY